MDRASGVRVFFVNQEGATSQALWPSGQVSALCTGEPTERVIIVIVTVRRGRGLQLVLLLHLFINLLRRVYVVFSLAFLSGTIAPLRHLHHS